jgi:hypothetical protein
LTLKTAVEAHYGAEGASSRRLAAVLALCANGVKQQQAAGNAFRVFVREGQPQEDRPPVVNLSDDASGDLTTGEVLGGKAAPAPLVLELVETIFRIRPIPII